MNNKLFDALEICLQEIKNGAEVEAILARYPELAGELRPILNTAAKARKMAVPGPSPEAVRRGRARVMQRAAELREAKLAPRTRRVIPAIQRFAMAFTLAAMLLMSGSGLVNVSASALPGEHLYPVKRTWEDLRLIFVFDQNARRMLEDEYESERLHEVTELLGEGRHESIQFAGVYMLVNGASYVSGVQVILPAGGLQPDNGTPVVITGRTNAQGFVEIDSINALPDGVVVPVGKPIEMETEIETDSQPQPQQPQPQPEPTSLTPTSPLPSSGVQIPGEDPDFYEVKGKLQSISPQSLIINGLTIQLGDIKVEGPVCVGVKMEIKGYYSLEGQFVATEAKSEGVCPGGPAQGTNDNGDDNHNNGGSGNDGSSGGDDNSNSDDDSGGGGSNDNGGHGGDDNKNDNNSND